MKRVLPVLFVSIVVNLFLFLMMQRMVSGEKLVPEKKTDFQGIEFIHFEAQQETPAKKRRVAPKPPVFQKSLAHIYPSSISKQSKPKLKKLQMPQSVIDPIKPLIHLSRKPYLGDFLADPPPSPPVVEASPVQEVSLDTVAEPMSVQEKEIETKEVNQVVSELEKGVSGTGEGDPVVAKAASVQKIEVAAIETTPRAAEPLVSVGIEVDVVPMIRVSPRYPRRAVRAKIEGIVTVEFTITKDGAVLNPFIVRSYPEKIFDQSAMRAIRKWKFRPKKVAGETVTRRAIQNIRFKLKKAR